VSVNETVEDHEARLSLHMDLIRLGMLHQRCRIELAHVYLDAMDASDDNAKRERLHRKASWLFVASGRGVDELDKCVVTRAREFLRHRLNIGFLVQVVHPLHRLEIRPRSPARVNALEDVPTHRDSRVA
jgi:hypothetical protein